MKKDKSNKFEILQGGEDLQLDESMTSLSAADLNVEELEKRLDKGLATMGSLCWINNPSCSGFHLF
jgi:hypothetical protein